METVWNASNANGCWTTVALSKTSSPIANKTIWGLKRALKPRDLVISGDLQLFCGYLKSIFGKLSTVQKANQTQGPRAQMQDVHISLRLFHLWYVQQEVYARRWVPIQREPVAMQKRSGKYLPQIDN
jgi:hypothetical protein